MRARTRPPPQCERTRVLGSPAGILHTAGQSEQQDIFTCSCRVRVATRYAGHISLAFMENY